MSTERVRRRVGSVLVALQFGLIVVLAGLGLPAFLSHQVPGGAWAVSALGVLLGVWAVRTNPPGNFHIRPLPRAGARLVQEGPYRWIRHPMYTAVMACGAAAAWASTSGVAWLALVALAAVLVTKAVLEERWMLLVHPGYAAYRQHTRWFLPWIA
ncbi:MAG: methyltransferase [Hydrogenophaga sp.]|uniref:methyltransferase family protein n=1 Tax=Hydrogenophaga sp. TaxID=1904254 RepID=UPI0026301DD4|nr:methyltransferase [Hydrogenophaga sp.]MDM7944587.1 methyltransferase [Hydrogenophaga sp.]